MVATPAQLAEAFSSHRFEEVIPHIAEDVEWDLVGNGTLVGRDAVVDACRGTAEELSSTDTVFTRLFVVAGDDAVAVDSIAEYTDVDGERTVVASCDVYEFEGGLVRRIRSYTVELG